MNDEERLRQVFQALLFHPFRLKHQERDPNCQCHHCRPIVKGDTVTYVKPTPVA